MLIISYHSRLISQTVSSLQIFRLKMYAFLVSLIRATSADHLTPLGSTTLVIFNDEFKFWRSWLCIFLHYPVTTSLLGPHTFLSTLFSNTVSLLFLRWQTKFGSHEYIKGEITVKYVHKIIFPSRFKATSLVILWQGSTTPIPKAANGQEGLVRFGVMTAASMTMPVF